MAITAEQFDDLFDQSVSAVAFNEYLMHPSVLSVLFNMEISDRQFERESAVGSMGLFTELGSPPNGSGGGNSTVDSDTFYQGYDKFFRHRQFTKDIPIERTWIDDQDWITLNNIGIMFGQSAARTRETHGIELFSNAFVASTDEQKGGDGLALCHDSHTTPAGAKTWDNKGTTGLGDSALTEAREAMKDFTDDRDLPISVEPDLLIIPDELEDVAWPIVQSMGKVETANNNRNIHFGRYDVVVLPGTYFGDANNWFLCDSRIMRRELKWKDRIPLEFNDQGNLKTHQRTIGAYMRYSYGFKDWRWVYGSQVA